MKSLTSNSARYLRKRILAANRRTDQIDAAWRICTALLERQFSKFYQTLDEYQWSNLAVPLVVDIRGKKKLIDSKRHV